METENVHSIQQWNEWAGRKTEEHFAKRIKTVDELRPALKQALMAGLLPGEEPCDLIFAPYQAYFNRAENQRRSAQLKLPWELSPNWLLALTQNRLLLFSIPAGGADPSLIPICLDAILYLNQGSILLHSWLSLVWVEQGAIRQETIFYNTVCDAYFSGLLASIRKRLIWNPDQSGMDGSRAALNQLPFKFKNMIPRYILLPGESVHQVVYRPEVWKRTLGLFRKVSLPRLVLALTNDQLMLIEEDMPGSEDDQSKSEGRYGLIVTYLPVINIQHTAIRPAPKGLEWVVGLQHQGAQRELSVLFPRECEAALNEMARCLNV